MLSRCSTKLYAAALSLLLLSGCASQIDYTQRPHDWPDLVITEQALPKEELHTACGISQWEMLVLYGCAVPSFAELVCRVFYLMGMEGEGWVVEHEHAHCRGHDHVGSSYLRDSWQQFKDRQP